MNKKEQQSKLAYDKIADNYENTFDGRFTRPFKAALVSAVVLEQNFSVLDVACGTGELLARLNEKCMIQGTGVDISEKMIQAAKSKHNNFNFLISSCAPLPFADNTFDALTVSAAFHHFPEPDRFAQEAFRVVKQGGRIYIAEVNCPIILRQIVNYVILPIYNSGDVKLYTTGELRDIFTKAGFSNTSVARSGKVQLLTAVK